MKSVALVIASVVAVQAQPTPELYGLPTDMADPMAQSGMAPDSGVTMEMMELHGEVELCQGLKGVVDEFCTGDAPDCPDPVTACDHRLACVDSMDSCQDDAAKGYCDNGHPDLPTTHPAKFFQWKCPQSCNLCGLGPGHPAAPTQIPTTTVAPITRTTGAAMPSTRPPADTSRPIATPDAVISSFTKFPGYAGRLNPSGQVAMTLGRDSVTFNYQLEGVDATCAQGADRNAANSCGIHFHAGTSCDSARTVMGHWFSTAENPWVGANYQAGTGSTSVVFGAAAASDLSGHLFVLHDRTGAAISCDVIA